MTAIVGVLNRHAVAIAADSAVTLGNTHKVVNSGNKIFMLSKYHPVAIMTYSNAAFMGVPWDIIIKQYRKKLKEKSFATIDGYLKDFIDYLHDNIDKYCSVKIQHEYFKLLLSLSIEQLYRDAANNKRRTPSPEMLKEAFKILLKKMASNKVCEQFEKYPIKKFIEYIKSDLADVFNGDPILSDILKTDRPLVEELAFKLIISAIPTAIYSGLVFVGYGEDEIYPTLLPVIISTVIDNRIRYFIDDAKVHRISENGCNAAVVPFAQTDVVQTIMNGFHPGFQQIAARVVSGSMTNLRNVIVDTLRGSNPMLAEAVSRIDMNPIVQKAYQDLGATMFDIYTKNLLETLTSLDKEDMANMAESFVALTSLIRRMSPREETVGGPVDVAVISKGDGFIWIKRKHYFDPKYNNHFFENYYND